MFSLLFIQFILLTILCLGLLKIVVNRSLLDDSVFMVEVSDFREMGEEVSPHYMVLVYIGALDLAHRDEVIC